MRYSLLSWALALAVPFSLAGSLLVVPSSLLVPPAHALVSPAGGLPVRATIAVADDDKAVAGDDELVDKIRKSIDEGVSFLKSQQRKTDGSWEIGGAGVGRSGSGGWTALALLALLNAGVKPSDEAFQKGLDYLRKIPPDTTYSTGLQTMVLCQVGDRADHDRIRRNVKAILAARMSNGWGYNLTPVDEDTVGVADFSNTQYALLGLHEAIESGVETVDRKTLLKIRAIFTQSQSDGGWGYRPTVPPPAPTMTMTSAGLCNLMITGMDLARGKSVLLPDGSAKNCGEYADNENVTKALDLIGDRFPATLTEDNIVGNFAHPFYCLYGLERAGRLTGQRYFGGHDWYEIGCRYLVEAQKADGSWTIPANTLDHWPVIATSFSLLFLSKGRTPVLISKLAYGEKDDTGWNNKRSDVKHLVEFASRELFSRKPLAWQAFDVRRTNANTAASRRKLAAELLQTPIVFFNGHDLAPRDKEAEILREYASNGGFIFAEACCGRADFDRDFRRLMKEIFPEAELKPLEPEHPVWLASGKFAVSPKEFPLLGIKQGCKTVVMYSPKPIAGYWESNNQDKDSRSRKAFELGANIIAYATGLEPPRPRLSRVVIATDDAKAPVKRGYLQVAQLRHEGDWQPAPKAMLNLMMAAQKTGLDVVLKTQPVYPSDEAVLDYRFLYMHGRGAFSAKKEDLKHLRFNLKSGGLLLADACCGGTLFDDSFRKFMKELFGDDKLKLEPIPVTDELYSADLNGEAIRTVRRRTRSDDGTRVDPLYKTLQPALEGIKYNGRWVVVYSKTDIGCALEKHSSPDCLGHDPTSALKLARAAVLYALKR